MRRYFLVTSSLTCYEDHLVLSYGTLYWNTYVKIKIQNYRLTWLDMIKRALHKNIDDVNAICLWSVIVWQRYQSTQTLHFIQLLHFLYKYKFVRRYQIWNSERLNIEILCTKYYILVRSKSRHWIWHLCYQI